MLTLLIGPAGIGRSAVLAQVAEDAAHRRAAVVSLQLTPADGDVPLYLVGRLAASLSSRAGLRVPRAGAGAIGKLRIPSEAPLQWQVAEMKRVLSGHGPTVVLIDDVQFADPLSILVLTQVIKEAVGLRLRAIGTVRTPLQAAMAARAAPILQDLRVQGLARVIPLRRLTTAGVAAVVAAMSQAQFTDPVLSRHLHHATAGLPAAVVAVVRRWQRVGALQIADNEVRLANPEVAPAVDADAPLLSVVRDLPASTVAVLEAFCVLYPLGDSAVTVAVDVLGRAAGDVRREIASLIAAGILRSERGRGGWRFTVPVFAVALREELGPYARARLAAAAIDRIWSGAAPAINPVHRAELLIDAASLIGPERAAVELLQYGTAELTVRPRSAASWLRIAAGLADERKTRLRALLRLAEAELLCDDPSGALTRLSALPERHLGLLSAEERMDATRTYLTAARAAGAFSVLEGIADDRPDTRGLLSGPIPAVMARDLLGRWAEIEHKSGAALHPHAQRLWATAVALRGRPDPLRLAIATSSPTERVEWQTLGVRLLGLLGERTTPGVETALPAADRAVLAYRSGRWGEALASAAKAGTSSHPLALDLMDHALASIHLGRGRPIRARTILAEARRRRPLLLHLLDLAETQLCRSLGDRDNAVRAVHAGLAAARHGGIAAGTGELWLHAVELAVARSDQNIVGQGVRATATIAGTLQTPTATVHHLLAVALSSNNLPAAQEAVAVARELAQPVLLVRALRSAVRVGAPTRLLLEAYDLLGSLDALLHRAWMRAVFRQHGVVVPGREATLNENERLVATLAAEGMSNRKIAVVLRTSEKGVESRLTRLYTRTGYRSRVEMVTAVLTGDFPAAV